MTLFLCVLFLISGQFLLVFSKLRENAADSMKVEVSKEKEVSKAGNIIVTIMPREMFDDSDLVNVNDLSLEVKSGDGCWTPLLEDPFIKGETEMSWKMKTVPCKEKFIRVRIQRGECVDYLQYPETVGPASQNKMENFKPPAPADISIHPLGSDMVSVQWSPSECADSYELWYWSEANKDSGNLTVSAGFGSVMVVGLETCTNYTVHIVALAGEMVSDKGVADFTTCRGKSLEIPKTIELKGDTSCESTIAQCDLPTPGIEEYTSSDMFMLPGEVTQHQTFTQVNLNNIGERSRTSLFAVPFAFILTLL